MDRRASRPGDDQRRSREARRGARRPPHQKQEAINRHRAGKETINQIAQVIMTVGGRSLVVKWINLTLFKFSFTLSAFQAFFIQGTVAHSSRYGIRTVTYYAIVSTSCKGRLYT